MAEQEEVRQNWNYAAEQPKRYFSQGWVSRYLHAVNQDLFSAHFQPGMQILDIGCGQGEDAVALAKQGIRVDALDVSEKMLEQVRRRSQQESCEANIRCLRENIENYRPGVARYDGICSALGAMNCVQDMNATAANLSRMLKPGGSLIVSVLNKFCLRETIHYGIRGQWRLALRRWPTQPLQVSLAGHLPAFACRYYTPPGFYRYFQAWCEPGLCWAYPLLLPPLFLDKSPGGWWEKPAIGLEKIFRGWPVFKGWGDHFIMVLKRSRA